MNHGQLSAVKLKAMLGLRCTINTAASSTQSNGRLFLFTGKTALDRANKAFIQCHLVLFKVPLKSVNALHVGVFRQGVPQQWYLVGW